jgi:3-oxoacyl-[acyl-carrier protein] reductase
MDLGLAGRVYVLTGASRGLGYATAAALAADGAQVVLSSRDADAVHAAAARLGGVGVAVDNTDPDAPTKVIDAAIDAYGRVDGGLISVGGPPAGTAASVTDEQWLSSFQTVFLGGVRFARALAHRLEPGGAIGFVLSSSVRAPLTGLGISNGLRPGLAGVAKDMADQFGPHGVRVLSLLPGSIYTDRTKELHRASGDPDSAKARAEATIPLRRIGDPEEFGRVAAFMLSPAASYVTGVTVTVDGGSARML